jgi:G3E family GTPase
MVTVVDGLNFLQDYQDAQSLQDKGESLGPQDQRSVSDLLVDQIEFADVIIINKMDLLAKKPEHEKLLTEIVTSLNPRARVIPSTHSKVDLSEILDTNLFSFEQAQQAPRWLKELRGEHIPETEEYGISSIVLKSDRPFHPMRFWEFLNGDMKDIVRSKGIFWLATRMTTGGNWSQAGGQANISCSGSWYASAIQPNLEGEFPEGTPDFMKEMLSKPYGDRRTALVFIGFLEDKKQTLQDKLQSCVVTDDEFAMGPAAWATWEDPFPQWVKQE